MWIYFVVVENVKNSCKMRIKHDYSLFNLKYIIFKKCLNNILFKTGKYIFTKVKI